MSGKEIRFGPYFALLPAFRYKYYLPTVGIFVDSKFRIHNLLCHDRVKNTQDSERRWVSVLDTVIVAIVRTFASELIRLLGDYISPVILIVILEFFNNHFYELMFP